MRFIHSNKQYIERTMYPINPYMNAPAVVPLTMEAFVAPANFYPDAQELNIVKAFAAYPDANKKYIFSVGTSTSTVLPAVTGRSYAYAESGGAYTITSSGTITWTVGSTKRNVIVIDPNSAVRAEIPNSAVWGYFSENVYSIFAINSNSLKYMHCQILNSIASIEAGAFYGTNMNGILNISENVSIISANAFDGLTEITGLVKIPTNVQNIGNFAFRNCTGITSIEILNVKIFGAGSFYGCTNIIWNPNLIGVQSIGSACFSNCSKFYGALYMSTSLTYIGGSAFSGLHLVEGVLEIPQSINSIPTDCFIENSSLSGLILPSTIVSLSDGCFAFCSSIADIKCYAVIPPTVGSNVFLGVNKSIPLHVPSGSLSAYQSANGWNAFTNIIADL